jgi:hypothetical protein
MDNTSHPSSENGLLTQQLVHLAIPVRWSLVGREGRGPVEVACTYDIHPHGARLVSSRGVSIGDMVLVERGRNKAVCQVIWAADPESSLRGQFTVQCIEGKTPWDDELRQMQAQNHNNNNDDHQYQPMVPDSARAEQQRGALGRGFSRPDANRRKRPRFYVDGQAEVTAGVQHVAGELQQISEYGARIAATEKLRPGSDLRLLLNVFDVSVMLKAQVKYQVDNLGIGVEFQEIRRGDRPLLSYVLGKLRNRRVEEFVQVEVVTEPLAVAG